MAGGVTDFVQKLNLPVFLMRESAHHLDLRLPDKSDPADVVWVREQEAEIIGQWIADYQPNVNMTSTAYWNYNMLNAVNQTFPAKASAPEEKAEPTFL